ncbi:S8 family peptidase [Pleomorphovibrio marinus]|uniref:S8 family peptidase n=1 Tax=Pleomorphovibrio marinus TaxID=2164132 RepID=UPI000E0B42D0|nr:S8 family peptidase [Pleomorphovibrio marinus]
MNRVLFKFISFVCFLSVAAIPMAGASSFTFYNDSTESIKAAPQDWFLQDPTDDGIMGVSAQKAHDFLKDKTPKRTVVVAVIDSGVDIEHEDLQGKIWVNEKEIPGNGIDDDKNGYVDDVNGWNFIGGEDGSHVAEDSHELTREYVRLKEKFGDLEPEDVKRRQREEYKYWQRVQENFVETREEAESNLEMHDRLHEMIETSSSLIMSAFEVDDFSFGDIDGFELEDESDEMLMGALELLSRFASLVEDPEVLISELSEELKEIKEHYEVQVNYAYNPDFDPRSIVGDDPENYRERHYGNNDPVGPDAAHGTHVSGIIAADRNNDLGIKGIAEHVLIMPIRAVPNGDERDKDIANAIRYAVDNGAHIINMSFGKSYSPGKKHVDRAVKYAERKGVVLIHAAGNSSKEVNPDNNFPNRWFVRRGEASNWIEVGAASWQADENLPARFSNYSAKAVDVFAPGVDIYSTVPGSEYKSNSGTSMAAPSVSGVAAILMAYYPDLKPKEVKSILKQSVFDQSSQEVLKPGGDNRVKFGELSVTGGLVNAYLALQLAEEMNK